MLLVLKFDEVKSALYGDVAERRSVDRGRLGQAFNWRAGSVTLASELPFFPIVARATDAFGIRSKLIGAFNTIKTKAKEIFGKIATTIRSKLKAVKDKAIRIATNLWEGVTGKFGEIRDKVFEVFSGIFTDVQRVMIDIWNKAVELAGDIGTGLKDGIVDGLFGLATDLYESLKEKLLSVVDKIKGFFSIFSPSGRMADELGKPIAEGVIVGLLTGLGPLPEKFGGALTKAIEHGRKVIERSRGVLAKAFDGVSGDLLRAFDAQTSATETGEREETTADRRAQAVRGPGTGALDTQGGALQQAREVWHGEGSEESSGAKQAF